MHAKHHAGMHARTRDRAARSKRVPQRAARRQPGPPFEHKLLRRPQPLRRALQATAGRQEAGCELARAALASGLQRGAARDGGAPSASQHRACVCTARGPCFEPSPTHLAVHQLLQALRPKVQRAGECKREALTTFGVAHRPQRVCAGEWGHRAVSGERGAAQVAGTTAAGRVSVGCLAALDWQLEERWRRLPAADSQRSR